MRIYLLSAIALVVLPSLAMAQAYGSVCLDKESDRDDVILTICHHARGMVARPQPRLYLRVYTDGHAEYEINKPGHAGSTLVKREFCINGTEVQEIVRLGMEPDLRSAKSSYEVIHKGIDSYLETTVIFKGAEDRKYIELLNYAAGREDNFKHYPDSLNRLMYLAEELRQRAEGIVKPVPALTYCEVLRNRRVYLGRRVSIYADLDYTGYQPFLTDRDCTATVTGAILPQRIGVSHNELGKKYGSISGMVESARLKPFFGRARVQATGRLRDEGEDQYVFEIDEFTNFLPLVLPYMGLLEAGWQYSDTIRHPGGTDIVLSSPLRPRTHHAARIEWTNAGAFPALRRPGLRGITFRVLSVTSKQIEKYRWNTTYTCEIVAVS
jgi:hypothetical protein